jgi:hypothetical protein
MFVSSVGLICVNYIKPTLDDFVQSNFVFSTEKHGLPILYAFASLIYITWLRYVSDEEGQSYTPNKIIGRNFDRDHTEKL